MLGIRLKIIDRDFKQAIDGLSGRFKDVRKPLRECGLVGLRSISKTFKAGGRPVRWKPSKRGGQTLIDTARLMRSITMSAGAKSVTWGSNLEYAAIHHLGGTIPARTIVPRRAKALRWIGPDGAVRFAKKVHIPATKMPAREFLVLQEGDWRMFKRIFEDHLVGK